MPTLTFGQSLSGGGLSITQTVARSGDGGINHGGSGSPITLPAGKSGNLTVRVDADTGNLTMNSGHGLVEGDKIDLYFTAGLRFGMAVGNVNVNNVVIDGGTGDALPSVVAAIVATKQVQVNVNIDGDNLGILGAIAEQPTAPTSTDRMHIDFQDSGNASIGNWTLTANSPRILDITGGATNALTGNVISKIKCSNGSAATDATLTILGVQDSTP